ncbi:MAG: glycosyltransferase [bacterium]
MKRVLVFTTIERAFYSSVIEYQLLEPIAEIAQKDRGNKFIYIGFIPINQWVSRDKLLKSFIIYKNNRKRIKSWLSKNNVYCKFIPILFPIRCKGFHLNIWWLCLYTICSLPILFYILLRYRINLVHSRNYPATLIVFLTGLLLGIPYIFDMRDLYPEKGIEAGIFSRKSWSYRLWKLIELKLIKSASYVVTTSEPFKEYVQKKTIKSGTSKVIFWPNCVNPLHFKPDETLRKAVREEYGVQNKFVLLHSGTFGTPKDIPLTLKYFIHFKTIQPNAHLVIFYGIQQKITEIIALAKETGIKQKDLTVLSLPPEEVPKHILIGDVGLHLESMAIATPYGIGVKDGEYLSAGLPIIVTHWQEGIAPLVKKYQAGIVVDTLNNSIQNELQLLKNYTRFRENGFKLVEEVFSLNRNVKRLNEIYFYPHSKQNRQ